MSMTGEMACEGALVLETLAGDQDLHMGYR